MYTRQRTKKTSSTTRWLSRIRPFIMLYVLMAIVLSNRQRILEGVRYFNKSYLNPLMLKLAERHHVYNAMVQHTGCRSGQAYTTPVMADFSTDGKSLLIPLPYGVATNWCRNVVAAGRCTIKKNGVVYTVLEPQIVDAAVALLQLPAVAQIRWRIFGIAKFLTLRIEEPIEAKQPNEQVGAAQPMRVA